MAGTSLWTVHDLTAVSNCFGMFCPIYWAANGECVWFTCDPRSIKLPVSRSVSGPSELIFRRSSGVDIGLKDDSVCCRSSLLAKSN